MYAFFYKNRSLYFADVPKGGSLALLCPYPSLSDHYENWEQLACSKEELKFLLPTNWELIHYLLEELKAMGKYVDVPEKNPLSLETGYFHTWKSKLKQSLSTLIEFDYQRLIEKYISQVFSDQYSKLSYKLMHPEEIKNKNKLYPTISGTKNLYSLLNRKLEILPLFTSRKEPDLKIYDGWPLENLGNTEKHNYSSEWISKLEKDSPDLFSFSPFKIPKLPDLEAKK
ncbi:hypothetical protein OVS_02025 [Mycoplasma ovis str. Michigan]|uniref:Uncharacterized protein n=1 Tax=Mycoplasma ovis str. Michigan TaxID=1415773 RepID=A0ABM5P0K2_9MOLU|nr:hypothetical protein [Mycoplasma ovis]AHC39941.1 hypothetical protein OVS_02025 [Mycoplasma ovis str. Michigan]